VGRATRLAGVLTALREGEAGLMAAAAPEITGDGRAEETGDGPGGETGDGRAEEMGTGGGVVVTGITAFILVG
jgi:hypothetical protein